MESWEQRVIEEKEELDVKMIALLKAIAHPIVGEGTEEMRLLRDQFSLMFEYSSILGKRSKNFK